MSRERSEERSTVKRLVGGVAGVQELQELQNKNLRNRAPSSDFLNAVFSEKSGNGCIYNNTLEIVIIRNSRAWQKAHQFVLAHGKFSQMRGIYCPTSQMRRASISVPSNIAEGFKKRGNSLSPPDFSENTAFRRSQPRARFRIFHSVTPATPELLQLL
jgi:hypothetical protein